MKRLGRRATFMIHYRIDDPDAVLEGLRGERRIADSEGNKMEPPL